jgi:hypothetical protein
VKHIRRLLHDQMNILSSVSGFLELALDEPDRSKRFEYMRRARKETCRAIEVAKQLRLEIEARYGDTAGD